MASDHAIAGAPIAAPAVRILSTSDLKDALKKGIADFWAMPSHAIFLTMLYPAIGLVLGRAVLNADSLPMLFPLAAGFPLVGAFAAVGLYELSRRREAGLDTSPAHVLDIFRSHNAVSIALLGGMMLVLFATWLMAAQIIYGLTLGTIVPEGGPPMDILRFLGLVFGTPEGWSLIVIGNTVGFLFALVAFSLSAVSFPLALDRDIGAAEAAATSVRVVMANPRVMALWGLIVAGALVLGTVLLFVGLIVVLPVLGHATWHLYRQAVM